MKKLKSVLNGFMGYGILSLPKKFTMNKGEGTITALKPHEYLLLAAKKVPSLTLPKFIRGGHMLAVSDSAEVLRNKIREDLDILEIDELKKLYRTLAAMAAEKAIKFAGRDWGGRGLSREKINQEVEKYRLKKKK